jgi:hypothetical protein
MKRVKLEMFNVGRRGILKSSFFSPVLFVLIVDL